MTLIQQKPFYVFTLYKRGDSDFTPVYFAPHENVIFNGIRYLAIPCQIDNLEYSVENEASPSLTIGDADGVLGRLIITYGELEGLYVAIRKITRDMLDDLNPNAYVSVVPEIYVITQLLSRLPNQLTYKLESRVSGANARVPGRILTDTCTWKKYRGEGCNYTGTAMFDTNNKPTTDTKKDVCALTFKACQARNNTANFSGVVSMKRLAN